MDDTICIGDTICLYCEDSDGYVFNYHSSSSVNTLFLYRNQFKQQPEGIPCPEAISFEICAKNRFKLEKTYRKLLASTKKIDEDNDDAVLQQKLAEAKAAAEVEREDNASEQKRQFGRRLRYGQTVQLKHVFTRKYIHVSTTHTSAQDKNYLTVFLDSFNAKHAQFRIQPKYKVKSEGDLVQGNDQVVLESVKSPGQFFHCSPPWNIDQFVTGCEINLGVQKACFTIFRCYHPQEEHINCIRGGSVVQFFHKELEAYLTAEGVFNDSVTEDAHLRMRPADQSKPKTMFPPTSAITYWQIELENSITDGSVIQWQQQVRLRHATNRLYLAISKSGKLTLTSSNLSPQTVFRLHSVIKDRDEVTNDSYARIEHVLTGLWLHGDKGTVYDRRELEGVGDESTMKGLRWDRAPLCQLSMVKEVLYDDVFTIQRVLEWRVDAFNMAAGMVPIVIDLIMEVNGREPIELKKAVAAQTAMKEMQDFMIMNGEPTKDRQKLLRNVKVVDLLVRFIYVSHEATTSGAYDETGIRLIMKLCGEAYEVLETYLKGNSRKNELYFAKYIEFFESQFELENDVGLKATEMITELIRDNRKIVDRVPKDAIDNIVRLVKEQKNYRYLLLLGVLCVCDGVALPENQSYIAQKWLCEDKTGVYMTEAGERINKEKHVLYVSKDGEEWTPLFVFVDRSRGSTSLEEYLFLEKQLELFGLLCVGRNAFCIRVITKDLEYLTWNEAYNCLTEDKLPDALRAKYCELIIGLFIDVGENMSVMETVNLCYIYEDLTTDSTAAAQHLDKLSPETKKIFPPLRDWIARFLDHNKDMTASEIGHNMLIEQVLRLLNNLVKFGYYGDANDVKQLIHPLLNLLDGRNDKPFPKMKSSGEGEAALLRYRSKIRFEPSAEAKAVVDAKYRAMEVVDLVMNMQFDQRLEKFVRYFKSKESGSPRHSYQDPYGTAGSKALDGFRKKASQAVKQIMGSTSYFEATHFTDILLDLGDYQYDKMVQKSMYLINKFYSARASLFTKAVQAQVLLTPKSIEANQYIMENMPVLRRLAKTKMGEEQANTVCSILNVFAKMCHLDNEPDERHPINQTILVNFDILNVVEDLLSHGMDADIMMGNDSIQEVLRATLRMLQYLSRGYAEVQVALFKYMDVLLNLKRVEPEMATALIEVFTGNQVTCMRIEPSQINQVVLLAAKHQNRAPEFLDLLCAIVKIEELDLPLKRNQNYVMKYVMQNYPKFGHMLDKPKAERLSLLQDASGDDLSYIISLVDLLATCAEGENQFIESICQTIFSVEDLLEILTDTLVNNNLKRPYLRFLLWVYVKTAGGVSDSSLVDVPRKSVGYLTDLILQTEILIEYVNNHPKEATVLLKKPPAKTVVDDTETGQAYGSLHYYCDGVFPFIEEFYRKGFNADELPELAEVTNELAESLVNLATSMMPLLTIQTQRSTLMNGLMAILSAATLPDELQEQVLNMQEDFVHSLGAQKQITEEFMGMNDLETIPPAITPLQEGFYDYYAEEIVVNQRLNRFAKTAQDGYRGANRVHEQLKFPSGREYSESGVAIELPLGEEFQEMVVCFKRKDGIRHAHKLIEQLNISSTKMELVDRNDPEQVALDVKCLQVVRALIHNEERKHSEGAADDGVPGVIKVQDALNELEAVKRTLPLIESQMDEVVGQYLAFLAMMCLGGNHDTQDSFEDYFFSTREEKFFFAIKKRIDLAVSATKERRFLAAQYEAKQKEAKATTATLRANMTSNRSKLPQNTSTSRLSGGGTIINGSRYGKKQGNLGYSSVAWQGDASTGFRTPSSIKSKESVKRSSSKKSRALAYPNAKVNELSAALYQYYHVTDPYDLLEEYPTNTHANFDVTGVDNLALAYWEGPEVDAAGELLKYQDEGHLELLLKVLAGMCDGQNSTLQNYLREQPDNFKSTNLVAETTGFLGLLYSHIGSDNIDLVIQVFKTLLEFASGSPANHNVLFDNNLVDYVNYILRSGKLHQCPESKKLELETVIGQLLMAIIEQDIPETATIVKEMRDTLDVQIMTKLAFGHYNASHKQKIEENEEKYLTVGFIYAFLLQRIWDLTEPEERSRLEKYFDEDEEAWAYYRGHSKSVEILKDGQLQRVRFRVKDEEVLREEVKETMKWNIDRSSPSNKIRDLMDWSKDIIDDIYYQRRIRSNAVPSFFIKLWYLWNNLCILLSLAINVLMLATWRAPAWLGSTPIGPPVPPELKDPRPLLTDWYMYVFYPLAGLHNLFALCVVISFFLSSRPKPPDGSRIREWYRSLDCCGLKRSNKSASKDVDDLPKPARTTKMRIHLFSFKTFYYLLFLGFSIWGTVSNGYFFAFHLLNIVYNNQLLQKVIQAITQNGRSLIWVSILGVIIIYIFALAAFAFLRSSINPRGEEKQMYCEDLGQCFVSVLRFGLIGDLFESLRLEEPEQNFPNFGLMALFKIAFFIVISTIGLNIIFGIILDTFSELRSIKWQAEVDMHTKCFICNKDAFEFETNGKGFEHHVAHDHNMWAYMFFFIHLEATPENDYTSMEMYVANQIKVAKYEFFPLYRALVLVVRTDDEGEAKLEEILQRVMSIVRRQQIEESERHRNRELERQLQWTQRHRAQVEQDA